MAVFSSFVWGASAVQADDNLSWTGFHAGFMLGSASGSAEPQAPSTVQTLKTESLVYGPRIGYDLQIPLGNSGHSAVIGVLGDVVFASLDGSVPDGNFIRFGGETDLQASVRLRLGVPIFHDRVLPYVTGGLAIARTSASMTCPPRATAGFCAFTGPFQDTQHELMLGYTVGAGVEAQVYRAKSSKISVSLFAEGRYSDFGERKVQFTAPRVGPLPSGKTRVSTKTFMAGVTLRF